MKSQKKESGDFGQLLQNKLSFYMLLKILKYVGNTIVFTRTIFDITEYHIHVPLFGLRNFSKVFSSPLYFDKLKKMYGKFKKDRSGKVWSGVINTVYIEFINIKKGRLPKHCKYLYLFGDINIEISENSPNLKKLTFSYGDCCSKMQITQNSIENIQSVTKLRICNCEYNHFCCSLNFSSNRSDFWLKHQPIYNVPVESLVFFLKNLKKLYLSGILCLTVEGRTLKVLHIYCLSPKNNQRKHGGKHGGIVISNSTIEKVMIRNCMDVKITNCKTNQLSLYSKKAGHMLIDNCGEIKNVNYYFKYQNIMIPELKFCDTQITYFNTNVFDCITFSPLSTASKLSFWKHGRLVDCDPKSKEVTDEKVTIYAEEKVQSDVFF
jgi:hypothetical protein